MATASGLQMTVNWDWSENANSNKNSRTVECYKNVRPGTTQNNISVVVNKHKVRGKGRALQITFTAPDTKDAELVGWGIWYRKNMRP